MTDGGSGGGGGASSSHDRVGKLTSGQDNRSSSAADLDGAFLLQLLRNPPQAKPKISAASLPHEILHPHRDPAVAAFGPSYAFPPHSLLPPHRPPAPPAAAAADHFQETLHFPPPPMPHPPGFPRDLWAPPGFSPPVANHQNSQFPPTHSLFRGDFGAQTPPSANDLRRNPVLPQRDVAPEDNPPRNSPTSKNLGSRVRGDRSVLNPISGFRKVSNADASLAESSYRQKAHPIQPNNSYSDKGRSGPWENHRHSSFTRSGMVEPGTPLGPGRKPRGSGEWVSLNEMRDGKHNVEKGEDNRREDNSRPSSQREFLGSHGSDGGVHPNSQLSRQLHQSRGASGSTRHLIEGSDIEESLNDLQLEDVEEGHISEVQKQMEEGEQSGSASKKGACNEPNMFVEQLEELLRDDLAINKVMGQSNTSRGKVKLYIIDIICELLYMIS